ncbi:MAG: arginine decarboxylase [Gemmatimonadetes bacterium]|nr:MAG: arginine decarboxylase [Gemmatimonadota bacterium]GDX87497.1 biosynthetic arginine decarboxylase [Gemmatimonadota bacterium]
MSTTLPAATATIAVETAATTAATTAAALVVAPPQQPATDTNAPLAAAPSDSWSVAASRALYNVDGWGDGYFDINDAGHVVVRPDKTERAVDLYELACDLEAQGVALPVLLRFSDILKNRIELLDEKFRAAIQEFEYTGTYTTVYPIKVNQQRHVVEEIVEFGRNTGVGIECGSKPELQAVLALRDTTDQLIVCNGYKDEEFMRLALMGQRLGHRVFVVIEQVSELDVLLQVAEQIGVQPTIGVRVKLSTEGSGRWAQSGGEKSKFGLGPSQLMQVIEKLQAAGRLDIVKLIHCHLGSQITDIRFIKRGLQELARYYVELRAMGLDITHVDVGGGLGVDYDGSQSTAQASVNYSLQEYANDIVYTLAETCRDHEVPMPNIISESGRALTAHHALLLLSVIDVESVADPQMPVLTEDDHALLHEMADDFGTVSKKTSSMRRIKEIYHDASFDKERAQALFNSGVLSLKGRAMAERLHLCTMNQIARVARRHPKTFEDIFAELNAALVDRYFLNFSLFQSLPDSWAIDQLFPIMPIHRLNEEPSRRGTIQDVSCDSDGKIDRFIGGKDGQPSLPLHPFLDNGEPYLLGVFLTGAYQEILGDLHNLFGDTNAVHVRLSETGYEVTDLVHGDTVTEVLNYVQYRASDLLTVFRRKVQGATNLTRDEANMFIAEYVAGLEGYTYLEGDAAK